MNKCIKYITVIMISMLFLMPSTKALEIKTFNNFVTNNFIFLEDSRTYIINDLNKNSNLNNGTTTDEINKNVRDQAKTGNYDSYKAIQRANEQKLEASVPPEVINEAQEKASGNKYSSSDGPSLCDVISKKAKYKDRDGVERNESLQDIISELLGFIAIGGVILFVVMSMINFMQALMSAEDGAMKKAQQNLFKRIIALVILLLASTIIRFILSFADIRVINTADPFCSVETSEGSGE